MPKDWIIFGVLAGFVGNIVKEALAWILYAFGWVRYTFVHIGAGYFVDAEFIDNPVSLLTGFIADWVVAGTIGVIIVYLLRITGSDYAILKGAGIGAVTYLLFYGALMALDVTRASLLTPLPNLLLFFPHLLYGGIAGWFAEKYGRKTRL